MDLWILFNILIRRFCPNTKTYFYYKKDDCSTMCEFIVFDFGYILINFRMKNRTENFLMEPVRLNNNPVFHSFLYISD